jgi:transcriptional regulator with GAF, ATPase, and Fis domain
MINATVPSGFRRIPSPRLEVKVVREAGGPVSRNAALDGERFQIGSHPANDLVLVDPRVSRFHCVITRADRAWRIQDVSSLNGTFLGDVAVRDADIPPRAEIRIGDSVIEVRETATATDVDVLDQAMFGEMFGQSRAMQRLFALIEKVAASDSNVLVMGESGTGKELIASEIVRRGDRSKKPFIIVDCGAIAPSLVDSELFGHTRGAFTGATRDRIGAFEAANGGTVFLDEVGELPLDLQPKLLRALESREIRRLGENEGRKIDVRVIAATNRELSREVNQGRFREDLYYRLSVVTLHSPPLRERREDIELLIRAFLSALGPRLDSTLFDDEAFARLTRYDWPGNVRELRNYVERCIVLRAALPTDEGSIAPPRGEAKPAEEPVDLDVSFRDAKERSIVAFERKYVEALMAWSGGNISRAARRANMDRMNLYRILQRSGLRSFTD